jgi:hypothetical protein
MSDTSGAPRLEDGRLIHCPSCVFSQRTKGENGGAWAGLCRCGPPEVTVIAVPPKLQGATPGIAVRSDWGPVQAGQWCGCHQWFWKWLGEQKQEPGDGDSGGDGG